MNDVGHEITHGPDAAPLPPQQEPACGPCCRPELTRIACALQSIARCQRPEIHDGFANALTNVPAVIGTPYLAQQLGCSVVWAAELARSGQVPKNCIVPGTGNGKPWKFYLGRVQEWLSKR